MSEKIKVYLAGGITNATEEQMNGWRKRSKELFDKFAKDKFEVINPVDYYNPTDYNFDSTREVMEFDLHKVRNADVILVNYNIPNSIGTAIEIGIANEHRIPVVGVINSMSDENTIHDWLDCMTWKKYNNLFSAVEYIVKYFG